MERELKDTGERLASDAPRTTIDRMVFARHLFAYSTAAARIPVDARLLDLGCGIGYGTSRLGGSGRLTVGVEVAADAVAVANRRFSRAGTRFALYGGGPLPFVDRAFDAVTSFQAIEHVEHDASFVAEIARVIRPDGICILSTPNAETRLGLDEKPWWRFHVREYRRAELQALLEKSFRIVQIQGVVGTPEVNRMEEKRIATARRLARLDPFDLRRLVPPTLVRPLMKLLVLGRGRIDAQKDFSPSDFALSERTDTAIDLMAFCASPVQDATRSS